VFPDYPVPVIRNADTGTEMTLMRWGMPPPKFGGPPVTNIRKHDVCPLARLAEAGKP
jgi:putative SOS response-associated peptidase YedK